MTVVPQNSPVQSSDHSLHLACAETCLLVYQQWPDIYVVKRSRDRILAVSGTRDYADWLINVSFIANDDSCHRGFLDRTYRLLPECLELLNRDQTTPITLTGHSLGGAVAVLLAAKLKFLGYPITGCVTFGQPMVGDYKFAGIWRSLNIATTRYIHGNDPVPQTPGLNFGFCHIPSQLVLLPDTRDTWFDWIDDHDMELYRAGVADLQCQ
jgi:hypothetical protein